MILFKKTYGHFITQNYCCLYLDCKPKPAPLSRFTFYMKWAALFL